MPAYRIDPAHPAIAAATQALRAVYPGQEVLQAVIAGTLPATTLFEQVLGAKTLFFSFSTADEKLHAPNEFLRLRRVHEGMRAWDALLTSMADGPHRLQPVPARLGGPSVTSDYASFGYLDDEPAAFARFPLAPEAGRVPAYDGGFDAADCRPRRAVARPQHRGEPARSPGAVPRRHGPHAAVQPHRPPAHGLRRPGVIRPDRRVRQHDGRHRVRHREHPVAMGRRGDGPGHAAGGHRPPRSRRGGAHLARYPVRPRHGTGRHRARP